MIDKNIKLLKILVVAGGWSDEREVSLMSGRNVFSTLKRDKFNVVFLDIKKNKIDQILKLEVKRMLPGGPLAKKQLTKLKIYNGDKHPHEIQNPKIINFDKMNKSNLVR